MKHGSGSIILLPFINGQQVRDVSKMFSEEAPVHQHMQQDAGDAPLCGGECQRCQQGH